MDRDEAWRRNADIEVRDRIFGRKRRERKKSNLFDDCLFHESNLTDAIKKFEEIKFLLDAVGQFDPAKISIESWFLKYDIGCDSMKFTVEQRMDILPFFFDSSLIKIINKRSLVAYDATKNFLIEIVNELIKTDSNLNILSHARKMVEIFDFYRFSSYEIDYWIQRGNLAIYKLVFNRIRRKKSNDNQLNCSKELDYLKTFA